MNVIFKFSAIVFLLFINVIYSQSRKDTIFLKKDTHHKIYIDNKKSKYYNYITSFKEFETLNNKEITNKGLNDKWIRIYPYKGRYVLYAPCDWCYDTKVVISNKKVQMKGCEIFSYDIISIKKITKNGFRIKLIDDEKKVGFLSIKMVDKKHKIFEFYININNLKQKSLMVFLNEAKKYNILVNDCLYEKTGEFKFDKK